MFAKSSVGKGNCRGGWKLSLTFLSVHSEAVHSEAVHSEGFHLHLDSYIFCLHIHDSSSACSSLTSLLLDTLPCLISLDILLFNWLIVDIAGRTGTYLSV